MQPQDLGYSKSVQPDGGGFHRQKGGHQTPLTPGTPGLPPQTQHGAPGPHTSPHQPSPPLHGSMAPPGKYYFLN